MENEIIKTYNDLKSQHSSAMIWTIFFLITVIIFILDSVYHSDWWSIGWGINILIYLVGLYHSYSSYYVKKQQFNYRLCSIRSEGRIQATMQRRNYMQLYCNGSKEHFIQVHRRHLKNYTLDCYSTVL